MRPAASSRLPQLAAVLLPVMFISLARGGSDSPAQPLSAYDLNRQALIEQFTAKQEAANWPQKFESIGAEMGVPPDVLAAVAFTETRWEQLTWPAGETVSPQTGMPHPYGIMSLWDNDVLGHSLIEAAALIGSTPEALKADPELNIRGAAALLKQYYTAAPLPDGTSAQDIESWQNAIVKYCGIQDPYLSYHHAFNCYLAMSQGYDQYGMHWKPRPVQLEPMRAKLKKLRAEHDPRIPAPESAASAPLTAPVEKPSTHSSLAQRSEWPSSSPISPQPLRHTGLRWALIGLALSFFTFLLLKKRKKEEA